MNLIPFRVIFLSYFAVSANKVMFAEDCDALVRFERLHVVRTSTSCAPVQANNCQWRRGHRHRRSLRVARSSREFQWALVSGHRSPTRRPPMLWVGVRRGRRERLERQDLWVVIEFDKLAALAPRLSWESSNLAPRLSSDGEQSSESVRVDCFTSVSPAAVKEPSVPFSNDVSRRFWRLLERASSPPDSVVAVLLVPSNSASAPKMRVKTRAKQIVHWRHSPEHAKSPREVFEYCSEFQFVIDRPVASDAVEAKCSWALPLRDGLRRRTPSSREPSEKNY